MNIKIIALSIATALITVSMNAPILGALAQEQATKVDYSETISEIIKNIDEQYPVEDIANKIIGSLKTASQQSAFFDQDEAAFVKSVNEVLWAASNDLHLKLYTDSAVKEKYGKLGMTRRPTLRRMRRMSGDGMPPAMGTTSISSEMINEGTGIVTINSAIYRNPDIFTAALEKIENAESIIIDLRNVPGGSNLGVAYFLSQFYDKPTHLSSSISRRMAQPMEIWSYETELSQRFANKKLYVLTSAKTASGAEATAFALKNTGRATLIGEKTAGAGNAGGLQPVKSNLTLFLPISRTINPETGEYWEGLGVTPHIAVDPNKALEKALTLVTDGNQSSNKI